MAGIDMESLMGLVGSDGIEALAKSTKTDKNKVTAVLSDALPVLVGKMSDNASTKDGAESLNRALNEHKTGDVIDVASFLQNADSDDGKKILGHILGSDETAATNAISRKSGVSNKKVGSILTAVAPLLLSQLGNKKDDDSSDGLGGLLGGLLGGSQSSSGGIGSTLLGSLLGGSSQSSSSGGLLGGLLGNLFGGKEEEKEEEKEDSSILGGLGSLAMGLFGDSSALSGSTSGKKKTGKKTGTSTAKKKTGTTTAKKKTSTSSAKKKTGTTSTAKKTGTTSTGKKTAKKTTAKK